MFDFLKRKKEEIIETFKCEFCGKMKSKKENNWYWYQFDCCDKCHNLIQKRKQERKIKRLKKELGIKENDLDA